MNARALLIGIDDYYDTASLRGPKGDVADIKSWLTDQGVSQIEEIVSPGGQDVNTATPRASEVLDWLDKLAAEEASIKRKNGGVEVKFPLGDRLYVFFAGHGYNASTAGQTGIFPRTTTENWDVLPFVPLQSTLKLLAYFKEIIFIVDACSEVIDYSIDPFWPRKPSPRTGHQEVKVMLIQAARSGEKTRELDFGGRTRGVLSQAFLAGVTGLAAVDGQVTAERLKGHIITAVRSMLPDTNPKIEADDPIVICSADPVDVRLEIRCDQATPNVTLKRNAGGSSHLDLQQGINAFDVPPGAYALEVPGREPIVIHAVWKVVHVSA